MPVHDALDRARGDEDEAARGAALGEDEGAAREDATGARGAEELQHALLLRERRMRFWVPRDLRGGGGAGECFTVVVMIMMMMMMMMMMVVVVVVVVVVVISWMNLANNL